MTHKVLNKLYPRPASAIQEPEDNGHDALERSISSARKLYPYPDEEDIVGLLNDLMSVLAMEDWNEEVQKTLVQFHFEKQVAIYGELSKRPLEKQIALYEELSNKASLIGA